MSHQRFNISNNLEVCWYENSIQVENNIERTPLEVNQIQNLYVLSIYGIFKEWKTKNSRSSITPKEFACDILVMERPYKNQGTP